MHARVDERMQRVSIESLDALSVDIARMIDHNAAVQMWDRYNRGDRKAFGRHLYTPHGQRAFELGADDGGVAAVVARRLALLVARVLLFVHDDDA